MRTELPTDNQSFFRTENALDPDFPFLVLQPGCQFHNEQDELCYVLGPHTLSSFIFHGKVHVWEVNRRGRTPLEITEDYFRWGVNQGFFLPIEVHPVNQDGTSTQVRQEVIQIGWTVTTEVSKKDLLGRVKRGSQVVSSHQTLELNGESHLLCYMAKPTNLEIYSEKDRAKRERIRKHFPYDLYRTLQKSEDHPALSLPALLRFITRD